MSRKHISQALKVTQDLGTWLLIRGKEEWSLSGVGYELSVQYSDVSLKSV